MDFNLPDRLNKGWSKIQKCLDKARDTIEVDDENMESVAESISNVDKEIKEQLDFIFDTDLSSIFGNTHLATPTKSGFLVENLMNALMPIIEREIKKAQKNSEAKKRKYTKRYSK